MIDIIDTFIDCLDKKTIFHVIPTPSSNTFNPTSEIIATYWEVCVYNDIKIHRCVWLGDWYTRSYPKARLGDWIIEDTELKRMYNKKFNDELFGIINE